jgi:hypothetical protein
MGTSLPPSAPVTDERETLTYQLFGTAARSWPDVGV